MNKIYIYGYGSLINFSSIEKTLLSIQNEDDINFIKNNLSDSPIKDEAIKYEKKIQIVRVKNIQRGWFIHAGNIKNKITKPYTVLGAYQKEDTISNGTLFPVTKDELEKLDSREGGYIRKEINKKDILIIKGSGIEKDAKVYYYSIDEKEIKEPNKKNPIIQSYVDICLSGCIMIDSLLENKNYEFTKEFLVTTRKWKKYKYFINDRIYPRTPTTNIPKADIIDNLLHTEIISYKRYFS